jgi:pyruvate dehydrogenase E1 component alpha subunit
VDGNDVFAVYAAVSEAVEKARSGDGPTLIECLTYRMGDHTTSDDAKKYRSETEVAEWKKKDPILRLERYLLEKKLLTETSAKEVWNRCEIEVEAAVKKFESLEPPKPEEMFTSVYEEMTPELKRQMDEAKE